MLRRLVLAPAMALLAIGTVATPASAEYEVLCVSFELTQEFDLPGFVPVLPEEACVPIPVHVPVDLPPWGVHGG